MPLSHRFSFANLKAWFGSHSDRQIANGNGTSAEHGPSGEPLPLKATPPALPPTPTNATSATSSSESGATKNDGSSQDMFLSANYVAPMSRSYSSATSSTSPPTPVSPSIPETLMTPDPLAGIHVSADSKPSRTEQFLTKIGSYPICTVQPEDTQLTVCRRYRLGRSGSKRSDQCYNQHCSIGVRCNWRVAGNRSSSQRVCRWYSLAHEGS